MLEDEHMLRSLATILFFLLFAALATSVVLALFVHTLFLLLFVLLVFAVPAFVALLWRPGGAAAMGRGPS